MSVYFPAARIVPHVSILALPACVLLSVDAAPAGDLTVLRSDARSVLIKITAMELPEPRPKKAKLKKKRGAELCS